MKTLIKNLLQEIEAIEFINDMGSLCNGIVTIEYKWKLNKEAKELWVTKDYNAYGRQCNILAVKSFQTKLFDWEKMIESIISKYGLSDLLKTATRLI